MKKLFSLSLMLFLFHAAVAQRWDQNINSPVLMLNNKHQLPIKMDNEKNIQDNTDMESRAKDDTISIRVGNHDWYSSTNFDPAWANRFQTVLDSVRIATGMKGASLAVQVPGQGLLTCVSGISSPGVPVTKERRFGIMSNTKLFIAVVLAKLQEQGILSLDDHLYQWLPTYPHVDSTVTIRQLLSHHLRVQPGQRGRIIALNGTRDGRMVLCPI